MEIHSESSHTMFVRSGGIRRQLGRQLLVGTGTRVTLNIGCIILISLVIMDKFSGKEWLGL